MSSFLVALYLAVFSAAVVGTYIIATGVGIPIAGALVFGARLLQGAFSIIRRVFRF